MVNNRYFYYLLILNALVNSINFIPRTLINNDGSLVAIIISVVIGTLLIYFFTKLIRHFPGMDLPEILTPVFPKLIKNGLILIFSMHWYIFGAITLVSLVDITHRFITPDVNQYVLTTGLLLLVILACQIESYSVLSMAETIVVINIPLILYFFIKMLINEWFSWETVMEVITNSADIPPYSSIAASTFVFTGYINLVVFNRLFKELKVKKLWIISLVGFLLLLLSFLVPIGYNGIHGSRHLIYPWISTADSVRVVFSIIERLLFVFYLFYITIALTAIILYWHVGLRMLQSIFFKKTSNEFKLKNYVLLGVFAAFAYYMVSLDQFTFLQIGTWFIRIRFFSEIFLLFVLFYAVRRVKKA
ncbi:GerAB/ArcD/ProY family transporter [Peribacillus kribbensis]|uniref:GerAB/ArcD/ProY family transporter n=1 Tax=Peribacillus kribbensis TaxID=356658 RepID=UPI0004065D71|nr:GerAB/ArcD/ProY family transporter [Peribacillus kribbensis]